MTVTQINDDIACLFGCVLHVLFPSRRNEENIKSCLYRLVLESMFISDNLLRSQVRN